MALISRYTNSNIETLFFENTSNWKGVDVWQLRNTNIFKEKHKI